MPSRKQAPAKGQVIAAEDEAPLPTLPEWDELPPTFRRNLLFLARLAYTQDDAPRRCLRRLCRNRDACLLGLRPGESCDGSPSEHALQRVECMWTAKAAELLFDFDAPGPAAESPAA